MFPGLTYKYFFQRIPYRIFSFQVNQNSFQRFNLKSVVIPLNVITERSKISFRITKHFILNTLDGCSKWKMETISVQWVADNEKNEVYVLFQLEYSFILAHMNGVRADALLSIMFFFNYMKYNNETWVNVCICMMVASDLKTLIEELKTYGLLYMSIDVYRFFIYENTCAWDKRSVSFLSSFKTKQRHQNRNVNMFNRP